MSNINKKQASLAVIAVVFAAAMVANVLVADSAYASSIIQKNRQDQSSSIATGGMGGSVGTSGNNAATATNTNNGGNAAAR